MDEFDEREFLEKARKIRPHAGFFDWPVKETKEVGVVKTLLDSVPADDPLAGVREIRPCKPDPPDVIGARGDGALVALEVTELVDQAATAHNVRAARETVGQDPLERMRHTVHRDWDETGLVAAVDALLREKDGKTLNGGPFEEYVVVLHTDEFALDHAEAEQWLRGHTFGGLRQITGAYLLFSYVPDKGFPHIRLSVGS
jgi:hypothetical protein